MSAALPNGEFGLGVKIRFSLNHGCGNFPYSSYLSYVPFSCILMACGRLYSYLGGSIVRYPEYPDVDLG